MTIVKKISKPFYKTFLYRIKLRKISRFNKSWLDYALYGTMPPSSSYSYRWWGFPSSWILENYPTSEKEYEERGNLLRRLTTLCEVSKKKAKLQHFQENSMMYFEDGDDYEKAKSMIGDYALEYSVPMYDNLIDRLDDLSQIEELRTCLFYKKYVYRIEMNVGWKSDAKELCSFKEQLEHIDDIYMNSALKRIPTNPKDMTTNYWRWSTYAIACNDEETASYLSFIGGSLIRKVSKAVVI